MGGYKPALNVSFLRENRVKLIVNTAPSLAHVMGAAYAKARKKVQMALTTEVEEWEINWTDSQEQVLDADVIKAVLAKMRRVLQNGNVM